ncbi:MULTISPECIES: DUF2190 family protein [unclassified Dietzia]|uniref:DUF2190 family protein n=1 Tax=unclassified Dietzia TaxID=2617939 RepID=UPI0015FD89B7|nr:MULTISPECIES: DUF2190 family protein [unclassified Dietzia]MBB1022958.1 DUF2190 family protein [Dietzia sp. DQ12-76]MBB1026464.1 DUF2190 family protein [Dietzia sp. DQ11-38-2]
MSNPTFRQGPISLPVAEPVEKNRIVVLGADGISHSDGQAAFGAVSEKGAPKGDRTSGDLTLGSPDVLAVHTAPATLPIVTDDEFALGDDVFAAADGKASTEGETKVGVTVAASKAGRVRVRLTIPA